MYWIVDDFVNPERPMYIYKSGNNMSATSSIGKAFKIEDETKATNIMNSLPKVLRKNHAWEVRKCSNDEYNEIGDNFEGIESVSFESYENILSKTKTTTTQMSALLYSQKQALKSHVVEYQTLLKMMPYVQIEKASFMSEVSLEAHCKVELFKQISKDAYTYKMGDIGLQEIGVFPIEILIDTSNE